MKLAAVTELTCSFFSIMDYLYTPREQGEEGIYLLLLTLMF